MDELLGISLGLSLYRSYVTMYIYQNVTMYIYQKQQKTFKINL